MCKQKTYKVKNAQSIIYKTKNNLLKISLSSFSVGHLLLGVEPTLTCGLCI